MKFEEEGGVGGHYIQYRCHNYVVVVVAGSGSGAGGGRVVVVVVDLRIMTRAR